MGSEEPVVGGFKDRGCDLGMRLPQIADDALARPGAHDVVEEVMRTHTSAVTRQRGLESRRSTRSRDRR